ncbi:ATP-binding protein [Vibrio quintilis]|uniref:ATP-dependent zinc metalloprotease FtsH n=1 Tax=Vibrio quintilis TaxID=1117707 RepID=A0A1M7YU88_9VIBR|nr:ATP-binding protein [Vibrio quintilis]SHO56209.1 ATP-dependent zinc metalloprotease FtsH [Vibrio quintilis]
MSETDQLVYFPENSDNHLQHQAEQQLAESLYDLGLTLANQESPEEIQEAQKKQLINLRNLLKTRKWTLISGHFSLSESEVALLAVVYLFQLEPDLLSAYAGLNWYERGPGVSAERVLSLIPGAHDSDLPAMKTGLLMPDSPLIQAGLLICHDPVNPLSQSLTVSGPFFARMGYQAPTGDQSRNIPDANSWLIRESDAVNPASRAMFTEHFRQPVLRLGLNQISSSESDEILSFVHAILENQLMSDINQTEEPTGQVDERENNPPEPYRLWMVHSSPQTKDEAIMLQQACLDAALHSIPADLAICWPSLWQDSLNSDILRRFVWYLIHHDKVLLFCEPYHRGEEEDRDSVWVEEITHRVAISDYDLSCSAPQRASGWLALFQQANLIHPDQHDACVLAERYPLSAPEMQWVFEKQHAQNKDSLDALQKACLQHIHSGTQHHGLATFVIPRLTLSDMILPAGILEAIEELLARINHRDAIRTLLPTSSFGLHALLWGPPGTGKSMAAEAMAGELCLPLYKVNLANVASKWIGETEKHLAQLFERAESQHAVLLFDEADAIFAKRSEVESSHDRHANLGVSFLLQRMETYQGILLLSTNFKSNIDDAFLRRFTSVIEFGLPDKALRHQLWHQVWPDTFRLSPDLDMDYLIAEFELSPSQIYNIAERACLFAMMNGETGIHQSQIAKALKCELDKQSSGFMAARHIAGWQTPVPTKSQ